MFSTIRTIIIISLLSTSIAACQSTDTPEEKNEVRSTHIAPFYTILAKHYSDLSKEQSNKGDWNDASLFSSKSLSVAKGQMPVPEYTRDWDVRHDIIQELVSARRILTDNITGELIFKKPKLSAQAFFAYDCWIEQEENWWKEERESCKHHFYEAINAIRYFRDSITTVAEKINEEDLEELALSEIHPAPEPVVKVVTVTAPTVAAPTGTLTKDAKQTATTAANPIEANKTNADTAENAVTPPEVANATTPIEEEEKTRNYLIYFAFDSTDISEEALVIIKNAVADINKTPPTLITLNGHADTAGPENYNLTLSEKRASAIHKALLDNDDSNSISSIETDIFGFGESDPAVETEDGVKNPQNRRVEIILE